MADPRPTTKNRAFLAAWDKGFAAAQAGQSRRANPYPDHTTSRGSVTFSRAFRRYWRRGWEAGASRGAE